MTADCFRFAGTMKLLRTRLNGDFPHSPDSASLRLKPAPDWIFMLVFRVVIEVVNDSTNVHEETSEAA